MTSGYELRAAVSEDDLAEIEAASDRLLEPLGFWPLPDLPEPAEPTAAVIVAATRDAAVGFVKIAQLGSGAHIAQLSVHPAHGRRGIGAALMRAAEEWAAGNGFDRVTLTTFADVAFNAPWYRRLGYNETQATGELEATKVRESPLEALGARVVMVKRLWKDRGDE